MEPRLLGVRCDSRCSEALPFGSSDVLRACYTFPWRRQVAGDSASASTSTSTVPARLPHCPRQPRTNLLGRPRTTSQHRGFVSTPSDFGVTSERDGGTGPRPCSQLGSSRPLSPPRRVAFRRASAHLTTPPVTINQSRCPARQPQPPGGA